MEENAELPENVEISTHDADRSVQDSAADFLREYIGVLNGKEFNGVETSLSEDSGKKFAAGLYQKYLHQQRQ